MADDAVNKADQTKQAGPNPFIPETEVHKDNEPPKVDHLATIAELARGLDKASPSGVQSISDKILEQVGALQDTSSYDERTAAVKKAEDEAEARRAQEREQLKTKPDEKAKVE